MKLEKQILRKISGFIGTYVAISWHNTHKNNICQVASIRRLQLRDACHLQLSTSHLKSEYLNYRSFLAKTNHIDVILI